MSTQPAVSEDLNIEPIAGALGAEIFGADLSRPPTGETIAAIRQALLDHLVIFFRDQELTTADFKRFASCFGELSPFPTRLFGIIRGNVEPADGETEPIYAIEFRKEKDDDKNVGGRWHSDVTHLLEPPACTLLYAIEVPPYGGDTIFANQYLAYETLPAETRKRIDGLVGLHSDAIFDTEDNAKDRDLEAMKSLRGDAKASSREHPMVRTHPETGRKALYVNPMYTRGIKGMSDADSEPLLRSLFDHAVTPDFTCRFGWRNNSLAFWDNRCLQHYAVNDTLGFRRIMRRLTISGDRPF